MLRLLSFLLPPIKQRANQSQYIILACILCIFSFSSAAKQDKLRIAVAANFAPVLEQLLPSFNKQTGIQTQVISGASGTLYQQIYHGAPFDVFLSADEKRAQQLELDQLIVSNSRATYAIGELALFSNTHKLLSLAQLKNYQKKVAIANPAIAPYGKAAKEALISLGLWNDYKKQLVTGININQTFQQVRSKAVELGVVAYSQLVLNNLSGIKIDARHHQAINQQLVIVKASKQHANAQQLKDYLLSAPVQEKIRQFGYQSAAALAQQGDL
ncbi:molybdate ABC transporter substrate-binding protein [Thalassotalea sp. PLHSN55]|uniref:molybdate ABC transporter substrate-binding protein n=1 Tax=Thalassotalea sp. PLHSN55 TaxID=3435888 RepID=UPI003F8639DD